MTSDKDVSLVDRVIKDNNRETSCALRREVKGPRLVVSPVRPRWAMRDPREPVRSQ